MLARTLLPSIFIVLSYGFWVSSSFKDIEVFKLQRKKTVKVSKELKQAYSRSTSTSQ
jgi:hypothetical protein